MVKSDIIIEKLVNQVSKYFESNEGVDDDFEELGLFRVVHEDNVLDGYTDFYVYAEISIEDFTAVSSAWNSVVEKYDPSAYFDVISPGIYMARVYWNAAEQSKHTADVTVFTASNLIKFGEAISLELADYYGEDFWVDDISYDENHQKLAIMLSSDNYKVSDKLRIFEEDIDNYQELLELYLNKVVKSVKRSIDSQ